MQIEFNGRLGNQMFQYAFLRHIESKYSTVMECDLQSYNNNNIELVEAFDVNLKLVPKREKKRFQIFPKRLHRLFGDKIWFYSSKIVNEKNIGHTDINDDTYFKGYWQNEDYFRDVRNMIVDELVFRNFDEPNNIDLMNKIRNSNSVSIHVRRTDYVSVKENKEFYLCLSETQYYKNAINMILNSIKEPFFVVFSDDIEWCRNEFHHINPLFVDWNKEGWKDMKLMSACKTNIVANSSFSWWAAYLNINGNRIVPDHLGIPFEKKHKNYFPLEWKRIPIF